VGRAGVYNLSNPWGPPEPPRDDPVDVLDEQDLGSDFEVEDRRAARGRRRGGSDSLRHARGNYEWERTYIREEQRYKDRFTNPRMPT